MALSWSERRRFLVIGGAALLALVLAGLLAFSFLHKAPSCTDGVQNGDETGIDCGGSCAYVCSVTVEAPRITFARAVATGGRTDVIAYVENRNRDEEAKAAAYTVELFDESGRLIGSDEGVLDLPARAIVPLFASSLAPGLAFTPRAFVSFSEDTKWRLMKEARAEPAVSDVVLLTGDNPRVTATVTNPSATGMGERAAVATVFDARGIAIAASRTVTQALAPRGSTQAVFTWPEPFNGEATKVEVRVVPQLP